MLTPLQRVGEEVDSFHPFDGFFLHIYQVLVKFEGTPCSKSQFSRWMVKDEFSISVKFYLLSSVKSYWLNTHPDSSLECAVMHFTDSSDLHRPLHRYTHTIIVKSTGSRIINSVSAKIRSAFCIIGFAQNQFSRNDCSHRGGYTYNGCRRRLVERVVHSDVKTFMNSE